nr:hypothetical protein [Butyrivibrio sp.]
MAKEKKQLIKTADGQFFEANRTSNAKYFKQHTWLYLMLLPGIIYMILFRYVPMGGLVIAFKDYSPFKGLWASEWVGFDNFIRFFSNNDFRKLLTNTLGISLLQLV